MIQQLKAGGAYQELEDSVLIVEVKVDESFTKFSYEGYRMEV